MARMAQRPLLWLTVIALLPRLLAAIFSEGYFAHDDHFLVIEAAQSWVAGYDYNEWLPWNQVTAPGPSGHMMVYPGLHYLLFKASDVVGLTSPEGRMVLVRLLHALWSLVIVRCGYRIALRLGDAAIAFHCGLFLALFAFMPFLSVRNMVEMVSAPFLMLSACWLLKAEDADKQGASWRLVLAAGVFAGLAINIRFQTIFFGAGAGLALLLRGQWRSAFVFGAGVLLPLVVLQGGIDLLIWGRPFVEMTEYVRYNLANPDNTGIVSPWYNHLLLLAVVFVPPLSLAIWFGFARSVRPLILWLPVALFILFHSLFPNKQERFLLPIVPLFFTLGYTAWETWRERSTWWQRHAGLWRGAMVFTWAVNLLLMIPLTVSSSKLERLRAMRLLREDHTLKVQGFIIDDTVEQDAPLMPRYYLDTWRICADPFTDPAQDMGALVRLNPPGARANAVLFIGAEDMGPRLARAFRAFGDLEFVGVAHPGLLDRTLHWLNPVNRNAVIVVFKQVPQPVVH